MSFELSFSPEFFVGPYDLDGSPEDQNKERPCSVLQALRAMPQEEWAEMAKEVFNRGADDIGVLEVLEKIRETNTCTDLRSPISVWIDEAGYFTVEVYDSIDS